MSKVSSVKQAVEHGDTAAVDSPGQSIKRRGWLLGLGAAGAAAVVAKVAPEAPLEVDASVALAAAPAPESGGYQLSPHVLRYYETARS